MWCGVFQYTHRCWAQMKFLNKVLCCRCCLLPSLSMDALRLLVPLPFYHRSRCFLKYLVSLHNSPDLLKLLWRRRLLQCIFQKDCNVSLCLIGQQGVGLSVCWSVLGGWEEESSGFGSLIRSCGRLHWRSRMSRLHHLHPRADWLSRSPLVPGLSWRRAGRSAGSDPMLLCFYSIEMIIIKS